ncbi:MAG: methyltransferase domain-containing protein, partial [Lentisphaerae bacterium]|nr:methyltransferase domain-containing protein [Lentisphaerota bacterium]
MTAPTGSTADAKDYFNRLADTGIWQDFDAEEDARLEAHRQRWSIRPGQAVLEPGCGAGRLTARLAEWVGPNGRVIACDPAEAMIARAAARGLPAHVTLAAKALLDLDLAEAALDRVICFHVWPHFHDPTAVLRHVVPALRPDGELWISHLKSSGAINHIHRNGPPEIQRHHLPDLERLRADLTAAGLAVLEAHDGDDGFWVGARRPA